MTEVASIVLFTARLDRCVEFYRALGVPLGKEDHGDGHEHAAADVGGVHLAVFPGAGPTTSPGYNEAGSTFPGFWVQSLEAVMAALAGLGARTIVDHQPRSWGCRAIFADPDGRPVEVNQRGHCYIGGDIGGEVGGDGGADAGAQ